MSYNEYVQLIQSEQFPLESPVLYGLHPNAEINFRTTQADVLFRTSQNFNRLNTLLLVR